VEAPLKVGLIGFGLAGEVFHAPLIAATEGLELVAIATGKPERQQRARAGYPGAAIHRGADELLAGALDLVVVAAPNHAHVPLGIAALEAGAAVVIDKPLAPSVAEGERLLAAAARTGRPAAVFHNRRWDGDFLTARRLVDGGALGQLLRLESRFERYRPARDPAAWRERGEPDQAGGVLFDLGSHLIDQAMVLCGQPIGVYAELDRRRPGAQVDDDVFVALRFAGGEVAHLWASLVVARGGPRLRLVGLGGTYEKHGLDGQEAALRAGQRPGPDWGAEPPAGWGRLATAGDGPPRDEPVATEPGAYPAFYAGLRDALVSGGPLPVPAADGVAVLAVIEAARRSAAEGRVVTIGATAG
jgi:scyllo-inositol 2-dehydrogenase (NADP+)